LPRSKEAFVTERETAAILLEFRRIGVDVSSLPDALVATGFRPISLLEWLREMPSELGSDELTRRLDEYAASALAAAEHAGSTAPLLPERDDSLPQQWWPTAEMLEAAIDILVNEWDSIGIRLGSVPREDFGGYAFHFVSRFLDPLPTDDCLTRVAAEIGAVEHEMLGLRASPDVHRRYVAARLREVVVRYPPSQQPFRRPPKSGAISRESRIEYVSTPRDRAPSPNEHRQEISAESRSWDDAVDFLRLVISAKADPDRGKDITSEMLREFASELAADADKMDGPMPAEVETFIREQAGHV
jgi:hypothetical protein